MMTFHSRSPEMVWLTGEPVGREMVGGKGAGLSRLAAIGAPVPESFALTTAAYRAVASALDLPSRADAVGVDDLPEIRAAILESSLPGALTDQLEAGYARLEAEGREALSVAVRSSATAEDSSSFSFAGLHDTILGVRGTEALEAAVKQIWASLWTERAVAYRKQGGLGADEAAIAVVVQRMIPSDASFIAFTADPVTGREDRLVIDAAWGLGEAIVSGLATPDHIVVDRRGEIVEYAVGDKATMIIQSADGPGTRTVSTPRAVRSLPALKSDQVAEVALKARLIAGVLGGPTDFEGGVHRGQIYFFQARPITTIPSTRLDAAA